MKKAVLIKNGEVITENVEVAYSFAKRFMGLMFRKSVDEDYALHIKPCNQIHMLNMRFAIDVIYLSEAGEVVKIDENVQHGKVCKTVKNAKSVLEVNSSTASKFGICQGDFLEIRESIVRDF